MNKPHDSKFHHLASVLEVGKSLLEAGVIPRDCISCTIQIRVDGPIVIRTESYIDAEDMNKITDLLTADPNMAREFVRRSLFVEPQTGKRTEIVDL